MATHASGAAAATPGPFAPQPPAVAPGEIAIGVVIGRASENFDFFVYGLASALVFPSVFFPFAPPLQGTLYAFALFALAFLARPVGSIAFMALQSRLGRTAKLTLALLLLGSSTAGMAFLPTTGQIGMAAIVLLAGFRLLQGLALGGAWDGLPSLLALSAPPERRGFYAMLGQLGAPVGFALAASLFAYLLANLSEADFFDWGWRYPFYVAFAINVVALFARLRLVATPEYQRLLERHELEPCPLREVVHQHARVVLIGAFAALASYALFHLVTIFPVSWILLYSGRPLSGFLWVQVVGAGLAALTIVLSGLLADRVGRRNTLGALALAIALFSAVAPRLLDAGERGQDLFILTGFALLGFSYGQAAGAVSANFPPHARYTGAALTSDLAWLLGAGFAPWVALSLASRFGLASIGFYLLSGALSTLVALSVNRALEIAD